MRVRPPSSLPTVLLLLFTLAFSNPALPQESPPRDAQAVAVVGQAIAAMGEVVPADSVATGTVTIVAGSKTETGTIRLLTRGLDQSAEHIETAEGRRSLVFSRGRAAHKENGAATEHSLELAVTGLSPDFPLVRLAPALNDPETAWQYIGQDTVGKSSAHHIRFWKTFASRPKLQPLAELSAQELGQRLGVVLVDRVIWSLHGGSLLF